MQVSDEPGADDADSHTISVRHVRRPPYRYLSPDTSL
jgi:hypothetical protein